MTYTRLTILLTIFSTTILAATSTFNMVLEASDTLVEGFYLSSIGSRVDITKAENSMSGYINDDGQLIVDGKPMGVGRNFLATVASSSYWSVSYNFTIEDGYLKLYDSDFHAVPNGEGLGDYVLGSVNAAAGRSDMIEVKILAVDSDGNSITDFNPNVVVSSSSISSSSSDFSTSSDSSTSSASSASFASSTSSDSSDSSTSSDSSSSSDFSTSSTSSSEEETSSSVSSTDEITSAVTSEEITSSVTPTAQSSLSVSASDISADYSSIVTQMSFSNISTSTVSLDKTTVVTITSCETESCTTGVFTTGVTVVTETVNGMVTEYTTYCPIETATTVVVSSKETTIEAITTQEATTQETTETTGTEAHGTETIKSASTITKTSEGTTKATTGAATSTVEGTTLPEVSTFQGDALRLGSSSLALLGVLMLLA